tara:strand:+ start:78 stop:575 length:498 start_codon:yes stop_codon:yes gene_type:complete
MSLFSKIKKAKDAANKYKKSITNKRDEKGNARNYFTPLSPNQKKPPTKKQQIVKNQKINTRLQDIAIGTGIVLTATAMSKDKKLENKANSAYSNDANTFTFNKKTYKTPTKAVLNKVSPPKKKSKPPEPPKSRPKVNTKQLMMKEGKTKKDSNVKFDSEVKKGKK